MKYIIYIAMFIMVSSCRNIDSEQQNGMLNAKVEKIIITNKTDVPIVHFLIAFNNISSNDLALYNNSFDSAINDNGIIVKYKNHIIPLATLISHGNIVIYKNSSEKYLFISFKQNYSVLQEFISDPNKFIKHDIVLRI